MPGPLVSHARNQKRKQGPAAQRRKAKRVHLQPPTLLISFDGLPFTDACDRIMDALYPPHKTPIVIDAARRLDQIVMHITTKDPIQ